MTNELINIVVTVETEEQKDAILRVLEDAELEGLDFAFGCRTNTVLVGDYLESNHAR